MRVEALIGQGAEDWYWIEFPENDAVGIRPNTGQIQMNFATNTNDDYRFQVFRSTGPARPPAFLADSSEIRATQWRKPQASGDGPTRCSARVP